MTNEITSLCSCCCDCCSCCSCGGCCGCCGGCSGSWKKSSVYVDTFSCNMFDLRLLSDILLFDFILFLREGIYDCRVIVQHFLSADWILYAIWQPIKIYFFAKSNDTFLQTQKNSRGFMFQWNKTTTISFGFKFFLIFFFNHKYNVQQKTNLRNFKVLHRRCMGPMFRILLDFVILKS